MSHWALHHSLHGCSGLNLWFHISFLHVFSFSPHICAYQLLVQWKTFSLPAKPFPSTVTEHLRDQTHIIKTFLIKDVFLQMCLPLFSSCLSDVIQSPPWQHKIKLLTSRSQSSKSSNQYSDGAHVEMHTEWHKSCRDVHKCYFEKCINIVVCYYPPSCWTNQPSSVYKYSVHYEGVRTETFK